LSDQATLGLKNALVLQNPRAFADLQLQQTAQLIRDCFANPLNLPLLQGVTELNLERMGLSLVPHELRFLSNFERLSLSQNQISAIAPEAFANLPNLLLLFLGMNPITAAGPIDRAHLRLAEGVTIETTIQLDKLDCF